MNNGQQFAEIFLGVLVAIMGCCVIRDWAIELANSRKMRVLARTLEHPGRHL